MQNDLGQTSVKLMERKVMEGERRGFLPSLSQTQSEELWVIIPHVYWGLRVGLTSAHRGLSLHHSALSVTSASACQHCLTLPKTWRRYSASFCFFRTSFRTAGRWRANRNTCISSPLLLSPFILFSQMCFFIPTPADTAAGPSGWILICMWVLVAPTARF